MDGFLFKCEKSNEKDIYNDFKTYFVSKMYVSDSTIEIGSELYHKESIFEEFDVVMDEIRREWISFQNFALYDYVLTKDEMMFARQLINKYFTTFKEALKCEYFLPNRIYKKRVAEELNSFINIVIPLSDMRGDFIIKLTSCKQDTPIYQYFHTFLEMEYYLLFLNYICGANVEEIAEKIMGNLIQLSKSNFQRQIRKIFVCPCVRTFWLLIQFFFEKTKPEADYFWKLFNKQLESEEPVFSLWLLSEIAALHLVNEHLQYVGNTCSRVTTNYSFLEGKLKSILLTADSDLLLNLLRILNPLLTDYWLKNAKVEVYRIIWEFYSKRLHISNKDYANSSALDLYDSMNSFSPNECKEDFEMYVQILLCHLREYPNHWNKIRSRIYIQLSQINKKNDLSTVGIIHFVYLFTGLSTLFYDEFLKKVIQLFEGVSKEKKQDLSMWNIFTAFLLMQVTRGLTLEDTAPILLSWIQEASSDSNSFHLIKSFISNYEHIISNSLNVRLHQWLFLNTWLTKYLTTCYHADMCSAIEVLLATLEKVENPDSWSFWCESFKNYVYPALKQVSHTHNAPGSIGTIVGKLYLITPLIHTEIFSYFTNETASPTVSLQFLTTALADFPNSCILTLQQQVSVIQVWFKSGLLVKKSSSSLTTIVTKLECFPLNLKLHLNSSHDAIKSFIEYLGSDIKSHLQSKDVNQLCLASFGCADQWLSKYLTHPESEFVVLRIYDCLSLAFLHCGSLLYHRSKSSSPLTKLIDCLFLSSDLLLGKPPHEFVLNAVKKTWNTFYEALIYLNVDNDQFLERTLRDLITKYVPHFSTSENPVLKCFDNEVIASVVLEKISNSYFKHTVRESDGNLLKVIKILSDTIESTTSVPLFGLVIKKTVLGLFELVIFHKQRKAGINLMNLILSSPLYPQFREDFSNCIILTTEKHLAFNTINCFELINIIAKSAPNDVLKIFGKLTQQVHNVERLRGVGYDVTLRNQLEKLEKVAKGFLRN